MTVLKCKRSNRGERERLANGKAKMRHFVFPIFLVLFWPVSARQIDDTLPSAHSSDTYLLGGTFIGFTGPLHTGAFANWRKKYSGDAFGILVALDSVYCAPRATPDTVELYHIHDSFEKPGKQGADTSDYGIQLKSEKRIHFVATTPRLFKSKRRRLQLLHMSRVTPRLLCEIKKPFVAFDGVLACQDDYRFAWFHSLYNLQKEVTDSARAGQLADFRCFTNKWLPGYSHIDLVEKHIRDRNLRQNMIDNWFGGRSVPPVSGQKP